jgi:hypothetical protein
VTYYGSADEVPEVRVALHGEPETSTSTGDGGRFSFDDLPPGTRSLEPGKSDDVGGAVSALDAAWVLQAAVGMRTLDGWRGLACDVTGNGSVSALDAALILQMKVGNIARFPAAENCGSDWLFAPEPQPAANQEAIAPLLAGGFCRPGAISYAPHVGDAPGQDFRAVLLGDCTGNWQPPAARNRGSAQEDAPEGTSIALHSMRPMVGGRMRLPVGVYGAEPVHAVEIQLRYDASRLRLREARPLDRDAALLRVNEDVPGRLTIALASTAALPADGRPVLLVEFQTQLGSTSAPAVHFFSGAVNEKLVSRR